MMGAIPLYINDIELGKMFPGKQSFYTSCLDAMACLSIMVPKFWQQWFDDCVDFKVSKIFVILDQGPKHNEFRHFYPKFFSEVLE